MPLQLLDDKASASQSGTTHYVALDAMRGIAAIAVMLSHVGAHWGGYGYLAVDMFFAMSGFVVARAYEPRLATTLSVAGFIKFGCYVFIRRCCLAS